MAFVAFLLALILLVLNLLGVHIAHFQLVIDWLVVVGGLLLSVGSGWPSFNWRRNRQ